MQHAALKDVLRAVDTFEHRTQEDVTPRLLGALITQYVQMINLMLAGTGRTLEYDAEKRVVTLNGGTESRGYGPVESIHATSITDLFNTKLLEVWGLNDAEQSALRTIAATIERSPHTGSGNTHSFAVESHALEYSALQALQGTLDIVAARLYETKRLKDAIAPLKESVATLMTRLDIQRGVPSSKGLKDIPFTQVAHSDYQKIQAALSAKGVVGEHADLHLGLILIDLVGASHEKVTFQKSIAVEEDADEEPQEFGEYRSVADVEIAAARYTEYIHDIIMQLEERAAVKTIGGFLIADLEREEHSVERLFDVVQSLIGEKQLTGELQRQYDTTRALVTAARDRSSTDTVRFAAARAGLIAFRDALKAMHADEQSKVESDTKRRDALLRPITQLAQRIESTLAEGTHHGNQKDERYTGKESAFLDEVKKVLNELNSIRRGVYTNVQSLEAKLAEEGLSDTDALTSHVEEMIAKLLRVFQAPRQRQEKAQKAFEHLTEGVLETATHHRVRFERIGNRFTFHIPTTIATVVQDARLTDQIHSGTYQSLAEAVRYANKVLIAAESQIVGLEERASEVSIDDALARLDRLARARTIEQTPYRSLRRKVTRVVAAMLGGTFGMFVQIPDAPQRVPMFDTGAKRDPLPIGPKGGEVRLGPIDTTQKSTVGGDTVVVPKLATAPENRVTEEKPRESLLVRQKIPQPNNSIDRVQLKKMFSAPVSSEHGTYALLPLVRAHIADKRTLTPDERKATDWFTHAFTRYINELPEERIAQLVHNIRLPRGVIASTIPSKVGGIPVQMDFSALLQTKDFWEWFDAFYGKRKSTSLAQPGLTGVALSIDTLSRRLKKDFGITE